MTPANRNENRAVLVPQTDQQTAIRGTGARNPGEKCRCLHKPTINASRPFASPSSRRSRAPQRPAPQTLAAQNKAVDDQKKAAATEQMPQPMFKQEAENNRRQGANNEQCDEMASVVISSPRPKSASSSRHHSRQK